MSILLLRTIWCISINTTTIESWEKERHDTLVRRARYSGGALEGPGGVQVRITRQEFPYDIGIFSNMAQAMGSRNVLGWPWPFAASLPLDSGLWFEENGIEGAGKTWPPPDPDRLFRIDRVPDQSAQAVKSLDKEDFRKRQAEDLQRYRSGGGGTVVKRKPFYMRLEESQRRGDTDGEEDAPIVDAGEEAWRNSEGERLADFGVEEEVEFYDEDDDVPLGELMRLRRDGARHLG